MERVQTRSLGGSRGAPLCLLCPLPSFVPLPPSLSLLVARGLAATASVEEFLPAVKPAAGGQHGFLAAAKPAAGGRHGFLPAAKPAAGGRHGFLPAAKPAAGGHHGFLSAAKPGAGVRHGFLSAAKPAARGRHRFLPAAKPAAGDITGFCQLTSIQRTCWLVHHTVCTVRCLDFPYVHGLQ